MATIIDTVFDDVTDRVAVDSNSPELRDITEALETLLYKYIKHMEKTYPKFQLSYMRQCGSMSEKTALWKSVQRYGRENKYIEFDYLVVLDDCEYQILETEATCNLCAILKSRKDAGSPINNVAFEKQFYSAFYSSIRSFCSCHTSNKDSQVNFAGSCELCSQEMDTGFLRIATTPSFDYNFYKEKENCSCVFYWISKTGNLMAPNVETLQLTECMYMLVIRVDVLPAFEIHPSKIGNRTGKVQFLIPKDCPGDCLNSWMRSYCVPELDALMTVSLTHRKCYIFIKFLYGQFGYWTGVDAFLKGYHAKITFIRHCQTCETYKQNYDNCIQSIFDALKNAYKNNAIVLPFSDFNKNLFYTRDIYRNTKTESLVVNLLCLKFIVTKLLKIFRRRVICRQHSGGTVVNIIRQTGQLLKSGQLWVDKSLCILRRQTDVEDLTRERIVIRKLDANLITFSMLTKIFDEFSQPGLPASIVRFDSIPLGLRVYRISHAFETIWASDLSYQGRRDSINKSLLSISHGITDAPSLRPLCNCDDGEEERVSESIYGEMRTQTPYKLKRRTSRIAARTTVISCCIPCIKLGRETAEDVELPEMYAHPVSNARRTTAL